MLAVVTGACDGLAYSELPYEISSENTFSHFVGLKTQVDPSLEPAWDQDLFEAHMAKMKEQLADREGYVLDSAGNLLAVDPLPNPDLWMTSDMGSDLLEPSGPSRSPDILAAPFPFDQTFLLHSLPGATKTIYLDFTGHTTTGTAWNSEYGSPIVTPAYNFQGSSSSFTNTELEQIQQIWERVSEDFLPFQVNVTTEEPPLNDLRNTGSGDTRWGVRVVIGANTWFDDAGGVAYLGSFNWSSDTPAFVFLQGNEKSVAEAISHEVGHALGLSHDGTSSVEYYAGHGSGVTGWAPIMGVGYNRSLTQWSRGEYPNASNTENDLQRITTLNGFSYRADDHGGSIGTASALSVVSPQVYGEGIIERTNDVDYFYFHHAGGTVNLSISPFHRSPNLDILATLYSSSGTVLAASNPVNTLNAALNASLAAGTYYISVEGTGKAAVGSHYGYSDYASLGYYSITGTIVDPGNTGTLVATLSSGSLEIVDVEGLENQLTVEFFSGSVVISDSSERFVAPPVGGALSNGGKTLTVPLALITGSISINTAGGDDVIYVGSGESIPELILDGGDDYDSILFVDLLQLESDRNFAIAAESVSLGEFVELYLSGTGSFFIQSDELNLAESSVLFTENTIEIAPQSPGLPISLGTETAGQLSLTSADFGSLYGSNLVIGDATSGTISLSDDIVYPIVSSVELISGGDILLNGGEINTTNGALVLAPGSSPYGVKPKTPGTDATASTVSFASDLIIEINGATVDVSYDQLNVTGTVHLAGVHLVIGGSFPGITGDETFTIVSASDIVGTFDGLPDQSSVVVHGKTYAIHYNQSTVQLVPAETSAATISGTFVYYKGSSFASEGVDAALDLTKSLAQEGASPQTLGFDNLINSSLGINGLVFDIDDLPSSSLSPSDFVFQVSPQETFDLEANHPGNWLAAPTPSSITVSPGTTSRVVIEWDDDAIVNRWLRITVQANAQTGLAQSEVYYVGHLLGETTGLDANGTYGVTFVDISVIRSEAGNGAGGPSSILDIDKNGLITFGDISAARQNSGIQLTNITIPAAAGEPRSIPGWKNANGLEAGFDATSNLRLDSTTDTSLSPALLESVAEWSPVTKSLLLNHGKASPSVAAAEPFLGRGAQSESTWPNRHDSFFEELALEDSALNFGR